MSLGKLASDVNRYFRRNSSERKFNGSHEFVCQICRKEFVDPRVLPCLHWFCMECLRKIDLEQNLKASSTKLSCNERFQGSLVGYFSKDYAAEGKYTKLSASPDKRSSDGNSLAIPLRSQTEQFELKCPTCGFDNEIPPRGIQALPPHYLLQHNMLVDSLNKGEVQLLCDLCSSEIPASYRCTRCLLNLCSNCSKSHKREKLFSDHHQKKLKKNWKGGKSGITRIKRQAMCPTHREKELEYYCSSCSQVACADCCYQFHSDHTCEPFSRAAQLYAERIKDRIEKIRFINRDASAAVDRLNVLSQQIESNYSQIVKEINDHVDGCVEAFEKHRKFLLKKAAKIKDKQMENVTTRRKEMEKSAKDIGHVLGFGEDLLSEGSDFERLDWCIKSGRAVLSTALTNCLGSLQFLPNENAGRIKNKPVYGIVTTQVVSPSHCHLTQESSELLKNGRENRQCNLILVTKDCHDQPLTHGAEGIEVSLRCQNDLSRHIPICIVDQQNGVYLISFTPDVSGKMTLSVSIRGIPIKGSPFSVIVRNQRIGTENFHCCNFSSLEGNRNGFGGCGGRRTPGAYLCRGHGCSGISREPHWSCCGNALHGSKALPGIPNDGFYQLSL